MNGAITTSMAGLRGGSSPAVAATGSVNKQVRSAPDAVFDVPDGATIMVSGFGESGVPCALIDAVIDLGAGNLTVISNNAGSGERGVAALFRADRVSKLICSYPRSRGSVWFERRYTEGKVELELVPQGTLSERIRAAAVGVPAFYTRTGMGTELARDKETRQFGGRDYLLEHALPADVALIRAQRGDRWGNLIYHSVARNYAPTMAAAAALTVAEVAEPVAEIGELDPEQIITPCIYVDRLVWVPVR